MIRAASSTGKPPTPVPNATRPTERAPSSSALASVERVARSTTFASVRPPACSIVEACITQRAGIGPAVVSTASPTGTGARSRDSRSSSSPPARAIAPATPPPCISCEFAALAIASTSSFVMSACSTVSSATAHMLPERLAARAEGPGGARLLAGRVRGADRHRDLHAAVMAERPGDRPAPARAESQPHLGRLREVAPHRAERVALLRPRDPHLPPHGEPARRAARELQPQAALAHHALARLALYPDGGPGTGARRERVAVDARHRPGAGGGVDVPAGVLAERGEPAHAQAGVGVVGHPGGRRHERGGADLARAVVAVEVAAIQPAERGVAHHVAADDRAEAGRGLVLLDHRRSDGSGHAG